MPTPKADQPAITDDLDGPADDWRAPLDPFDPDPEDDSLSDTVVTSLDIGQLIDAPDEDGEQDTQGFVLDIGTLLAGADRADDAEVDDEALGPDDAPPPGVTTPQDAMETLGGDADEGPLEPHDVLGLGALPPLDDPDGDRVELDPRAFGSLELSDAPPPPWAAERWHEIAGASVQGPCAALGIGRTQTLVAGDRLYRFSTDDPPRVDDLRLARRALSVALVDSEECILMTDVVGRMFRARLDTSPLPESLGWKNVTPRDSIGSGTVRVLQARPDGPGSILLAHSSDGRMLRSTDAGETWAPMELHGQVLSVGAHALPLIAVLQNRSGRALIVSERDGSDWRVLRTEAATHLLRRWASPLVAALGSVIALAEPFAGTFVSVDDGQTFERIPGCDNVTAIATGERRGSTRLWIALYVESEQRVQVVEFDTATQRAERTAERQMSSQDTPDADIASGEVSELRWAPAQQRLWAIGAWGALAWGTAGGAKAS